MNESEVNRPLSELFGDLSREIAKLARQEFQYAKTEVVQELKQGSKDVIMMAIGGTLSFAGLLYLLGAAAAALALVVPWWLAMLIVAAVTLFLGTLFISLGLSRLRSRNLVPERTLEHLKEDRAWLAKQVP